MSTLEGRLVAGPLGQQFQDTKTAGNMPLFAQIAKNHAELTQATATAAISPCFISFQ